MIEVEVACELCNETKTFSVSHMQHGNPAFNDCRRIVAYIEHHGHGDRELRVRVREVRQ